MRVKWTPDKDQLLLLKILETHDLSVNAQKISSAWPTDQGEVPTARAITERLVKIRQNARASGAGHFGISSSRKKGASSSPGTPCKRVKLTQGSSKEGSKSSPTTSSKRSMNLADTVQQGHEPASTQIDLGSRTIPYNAEQDLDSLSGTHDATMSGCLGNPIKIEDQQDDVREDATNRSDCGSASSTQNEWDDDDEDLA